MTTTALDHWIAESGWKLADDEPSLPLPTAA
jgi:hypothetical protein